MSMVDDDALYNMSDEELEAAFRDAKSGSVELDEEVDTDVEETQEEVEDEVEIEEEEEEEEEEDVESEEEEDLEQPEDDEDSNEEDDETEEEESTEEPDEDAEDNQEAEEDESEPEPEVKTYTYKANGQEFEFTEDEIKEQFGKVFGQSMNYTQKMQEIAPWRKTISALKDNNLSHNDVNLMIDALKGDKDAVASLVKRAGIDALDLDTEEEKAYTPRDYGRSESELAIDDVVSTISKDTEFTITQHVVDKQWDSSSRQKMVENPAMIRGLHNDIKDGTFDKVSPIAMKLKVLDGGTKSDLEYYIEAGTQYNQKLEADRVAAAERESAQIAREEARQAKAKVDAVKAKKATQSATKKAATKRKAAAPTKKAAGKKDIIDYLDDESFAEWEKEYNRKFG